MNLNGVSKHLARALALFLFVSLPAFANNAHTLHTLQMSDSVVTPNGMKIPAGIYDVTYESHSPTATVTFKQGKRVVATVDGKWVDRDVEYKNNAIVYNVDPAGSRTLIEIRFAGRRQALELDSAR
jgi:hypothetical protein